MDETLIEKAKNGNEHAFRLLVEKYRTHIFKSVYPVLRNQKDAEDAAQEVFLKIYTSLHKYENKGFKTWITRIAVNHAIDIMRKQKRRREESLSDIETTEQEASRIESTEQLVIAKERRQYIRSRIKELPESYREVIIGFYIMEKSYQQLAEEQQVQVKTIETKLFRARKWMKKHWKENDFS
ncbi:RNA polymerase sigma factor [Oceanobacillus chungangensis]|uniref:RNA polymerase subunit sigma n=1 Tax=Oceanobacillus chungangensis TaxID=1229152 RepID=A0A3D8PS87_9BACI|nr:sigma-70 family RNA polymerase sigma factor [Oceanobacillus chungangensis]RDW18983.1 RNA polymerase subunit sigma [Oceanobacillus chungangensis]